MKKAVVYGAGVIGRGYIGAIFSMSGYAVTFIDVAERVIADINRLGEYPVCFLMPDGDEEHRIENVTALHANERSAVARAIADADLCATAVGANALKFIVENVIAGVRLRMAENKPPLNVILCENLIDANQAFSKLLEDACAPGEWEGIAANIGIVEACIGTTVPVQTPEMLKASPLRLCMERHVPLIVDAEGFIGDAPPILTMECYSCFDFYVRRKLYIHNMGHACCAYLGMYKGYTYIHEAILDPEIRLVCQSAMTEVALALSRAYGRDAAEIYDYAVDLLVRFQNEKIQVTCERVGTDTLRKLQRDDRLVGAALFCLRHGVAPGAIVIGIAAALTRHQAEYNESLRDLAGDVGVIEEAVYRLCGAMSRNEPVAELSKTGDRWKLGVQAKVHSTEASV